MTVPGPAPARMTTLPTGRSGPGSRSPVSRAAPLDLHRRHQNQTARATPSMSLSPVAPDIPAARDNAPDAVSRQAHNSYVHKRSGIEAGGPGGRHLRRPGKVRRRGPMWRDRSAPPGLTVPHRQVGLGGLAVPGPPSVRGACRGTACVASAARGTSVAAGRSAKGVHGERAVIIGSDLLSGLRQPLEWIRPPGCVPCVCAGGRTSTARVRRNL